jgi:hypothetical protein
MVGNKTFAVFVTGEWFQRKYRLEWVADTDAFGNQKLHFLVHVSQICKAILL